MAIVFYEQMTMEGVFPSSASHNGSHMRSVLAVIDQCADFNSSMVNNST